MKINREDGLLVINFTKNTFLYFENDWRQLFGKYNWKTYRFADIYYENDIMMAGQEFRFILLGFGLTIRRQSNSPKLKELRNIAKKAKSIILITNGEK